MATDLSTISKRIEGLKEAFQSGRFGDALFQAMNEGNALMQQRIFQQNRDVDGNDFDGYVGAKHVAKLKQTSNSTARKRAKRIVGVSLTPYQRKRALSGRQIGHKDLELTGGLRRSIKTVIKDEKRVTIEFENDQEAKIARGQENQITNIRNGSKAITTGNGIKIFTLNEDERNHVIQRGAELITEILNPK